MELYYQTRDGDGNDIEKIIKTKEYPIRSVCFECPICHKHYDSGVYIKDIVSSKFTDWVYVDDYICESCSALFSIYFYNYIIDPDGVRLINIRQIRDELTKPQKPPFKFIITTTQKKHLFYKAETNYSSNRFAVNLETETIYTTCDRMKYLFSFVENLQVLGQSKDQLKRGEIRFDIVLKIGFEAINLLQKELNFSREIQIPLYCGQKLEISEEEAICNLNSILTA